MAKNIQRAGLIPFHVTESKDILLMFMKPSDAEYGGTEFQIAKGHIDPNENPLEAAVREASEELGLKESNILWIRKAGIFLRTHHIYIAELSSMDKSHFNKPTFETGEVGWITFEEFSNIGRPLHKSIVNQCYKLFQSIHD